jgi:hypothetical protein
MPEYPRFIIAQGEPFTIYARTVTGRISELQVHGGSTVLDLKLLLQEQQGVPVDQQSIYYEGRQLADGEIIHRSQANVH